MSDNDLTDEELDALVEQQTRAVNKRDEFEALMNAGLILRAITTLRAQLAEVKAEKESLGRELNLARYGQPDFSWQVHKEAIAEANSRADRADAALTAQIEADAWQPIETAPTDYTHIIGIDAKGCVARTWFFAPSSLTRYWLRVGLPGKAVWHPTHWKPLHEHGTRPHDRTALDRMLVEAREKALREAIEAYPKGIRAILALIENKEQS